MNSLQPERRVARSRGDLAYFAFGAGPPLLFANGLGASWRGFHNQLVHLGSRYRCLAWDYRGLFRSEANGGGACSIEEHAADALAILDHEGVERAAVLGWSLGVQVALQLFAFAPDRVAALALVSGTSSAGWSRVASRPGWRRLYPGAFAVLSRAPDLVARVVRAGSRSPELVSWARRLGLVGAGADRELVAELARELGRLDIASLLETLRTMGELDLGDVLATIDVPTLVIGGDRDPFTSRAQSTRPSRAIGKAAGAPAIRGSRAVALLRVKFDTMRVLCAGFPERGY